MVVTTVVESGRASKSRAVLTRAFVLVASALVGCGPGAAEREVCGYRCGPVGECPDGFACYADGRCHREGSPETRGCTVDGGPDVVPSIASAHPSDNESGFPTDEVIRIAFDEVVHGVDGTSITLRRRSEFEPLAATVTYDANARTATLAPAIPLDEGTIYVITVAPTIVDEFGRPFPGRSWEFTTVRDMSPPTSVSRAPADGATGVGLDAPIVITFSERVTNITPTSFIVRDQHGNAAGAITYLESQIAKATGPWAPNTTYTVTLASAIIDLAGNPLVGTPITWSFTTGTDIVRPRITDQRPYPTETEVSPSSIVIIEFSEPMIGVSDSTVMLQLDGERVPAAVAYPVFFGELRLTPSQQLLPGRTYTVVITPGLTDGAGNPIAPGTLSWTFETAE